MESLLAKRISGILRSGLTPLLRAHEFRKCGQVYVSERGDVSWVVHVQRSRWNDETEAQFTINGGIYTPGVVGAYLGRPEPSALKLVDCCLSVRIGMLSESKFDKWWKVAASDVPEGAADKRSGSEVCSWVESLLLPFLQRFRLPVEIAGFLGGPADSATSSVSPQSMAQRYAYASLIYLRLGEVQEARGEIEKAVREAEGTAIEQVIQRLRAQVLSA